MDIKCSVKTSCFERKVRKKRVSFPFYVRRETVGGGKVKVINWMAKTK